MEEARHLYEEGEVTQNMTLEMSPSGDVEDFQVVVTLDDLISMIGIESVSVMQGLYGTDIGLIKLRRVRKELDERDLCEDNSWIDFHLDHSLRTLQVPLNSEYEGCSSF